MFFVIRTYYDPHISRRIIKRFESREEAEEHCRGSEASSKTCVRWWNVRRTKYLGHWTDRVGVPGSRAGRRDRRRKASIDASRVPGGIPARPTEDAR